MDRRKRSITKDPEIIKLEQENKNLQLEKVRLFKEKIKLRKRLEDMENAEKLSAKVTIELETNEIVTSVTSCEGCKNCRDIPDCKKYCYIVTCEK